MSPFSIAAALTMTYAGARNLTAQQMSDVLHLLLPAAELHEARNELALRIGDTPLPGPDDERTPLRINIANSLWGQYGFAFEQEFLETLASAYDAGVRLVDFVADADGARVDINDWVAEQTNDRIVDLLPPGSVNVDTRLVLTNAIWFKANWSLQFDPESTESSTFRLLDGSEVTVPMMNGGGRMSFTRGDGYKAARLGYVGDASMLVVAPDPGRFDEIVASFDATFLAGLNAGLSTHALDLSMPRFEFESELSLQSLLAGLGMADAFDPIAADFSGISTQRDDLHIQDVLHKAFISVDEEGTEAAAATAVVVGVTSAPPPATLTLDNPFIYLIRHNSTGEILFAGTVTNPAA
jgi:serpin B